MAGSAAVNALMAKTTLGRSAKCTVCGADSESIEHFVLDCLPLMDTRAKHMKEVFYTCKCETSCLRTFGSLGGQTEGLQARFALPVGWSPPCAEADASFNAMINAMWKIRAERLEKKHGVIKHKRSKKRKGPRESPDIRRAFGNKPQGVPPIPSPCGGTSVRTHTHPTADDDEDDNDGDGDNTLRATEPTVTDADDHESVSTRPTATRPVGPLLTRDVAPPYIPYMPGCPSAGAVEAYVSDQLRN